MLRILKRQVIYDALLSVVHFSVYDISLDKKTSKSNVNYLLKYNFKCLYKANYYSYRAIKIILNSS